MKRFSVIFRALFFTLFYTIVGFFALFIIGALLNQQTLDDNIAFLNRFISDPARIGSAVPSSHALGHAMLKYLRDKGQRPCTILETGAGNGVFSDMIIAQLSHNDRFDIVEADRNFARILKDRYKHHPNVFVHHTMAENWSPSYRYDYIVSSLPFHSMDPGVVHSIVTNYVKLLLPGGTCSYFWYMTSGTAFNGGVLPSQSVVSKYLESVRKQFEIGQEVVYFNIPPANVSFLRFR